MYDPGMLASWYRRRYGSAMQRKVQNNGALIPGLAVQWSAARTLQGDQVIREDPAGAVVVRA